MTNNVQTQQKNNNRRPNTYNNQQPAVIEVQSSAIADSFNPRELESLGIDAVTLSRWKRHYAPDAPVDDYLKFIEKCVAYGVDPRRNRAYLVGRWDSKAHRNVFTFQMSFPGFLFLANKSGQFQGFTPVEYCDKKGRWRDIWLTEDPDTGEATPYPYACRVGVRRAGFPEPNYVSILFAERAYIEKTDDDGNKAKKLASPFWEKMPITMIEKCAKVHALREVFEDYVGGIYIPEEMTIADAEKRYVETMPAYDMADPQTNDAPVAGEPALAPVSAPAQQAGQVVEEQPNNITPINRAATVLDAPRRLQPTEEEVIPSEDELIKLAEQLQVSSNGIVQSWDDIKSRVLRNDIRTGKFSQEELLQRNLEPAECQRVHAFFKCIQERRSVR